MPPEPYSNLEPKQVNLQTRKDFLIRFHNASLQQLIADQINFLTFAKAKDNEVFAMVPVQVPGTREITNRRITIGEQKAKLAAQIKQQLMLLSTMEDLLKGEGVDIPKESQAKEHKQIQIV